jgi:hypothetical protein
MSRSASSAAERRRFAIVLALAGFGWQLACCALQCYWRNSAIGSLYCAEDYFNLRWPRWLLQGSEVWTVLIACCCAAGCFAGRTKMGWSWALRLNAAGLVVLCIGAVLKIGPTEIDALCNLDKKHSLMGPSWDELREPVWTRIWVGVLPLGGPVWMALLAGTSLLASRLLARVRS